MCLYVIYIYILSLKYFKNFSRTPSVGGRMATTCGTTAAADDFLNLFRGGAPPRQPFITRTMHRLYFTYFVNIWPTTVNHKNKKAKKNVAALPQTGYYWLQIEASLSDH
jgi:hypothetical protein